MKLNMLSKYHSSKIIIGYGYILLSIQHQKKYRTLRQNAQNTPERPIFNYSYNPIKVTDQLKSQGLGPLQHKT